VEASVSLQAAGGWLWNGPLVPTGQDAVLVIGIPVSKTEAGLAGEQALCFLIRFFGLWDVSLLLLSVPVLRE
jgi:hypothetical protein